MKGHILYTAKDFKHISGEELETNTLVNMVLDGDLNVCKVCGEFESGLDKPCGNNLKKDFFQSTLTLVYFIFLGYLIAKVLPI